MHKSIRHAALATLVLGTATLGAVQAWAGNRDFTLKNELPWTAATVFVRPSGTQAWSPDLLGQGLLRSGQQTTLRLGHGEQCLFDVRVGVADRTAVALPELPRVNLCTLTSMTLYWDGQFKARTTSLR